MADVFSAKKRSAVMALIRGSGNKSTEMLLAAAFRRAGVKGWRRHRRIPISTQTVSKKSRSSFTAPDFSFAKERVAVFADGCFWHGCPQHQQWPVSRHRFWRHKITSTRTRDRYVRKALQKDGWAVVRFWEHEIEADTDRCARSILRVLQKQRLRPSGTMKPPT